MRLTSAYNKILELDGRYRIVQGGMRAGKTFAILQYLISLAEQLKYKKISVISNTFPALRLGAMADFELILRETGHWIYFDENKTTHTWTCKATGTKIEFVGLDEDLKARGAARDILFINEANRIKYEVFNQLALRTSQFIIVDYNPSSKFWVHTEIKDQPNSSFLRLTYLDNEEIHKSIKADLDAKPKDTNWWKVYGLGEIGELEGNIYKDWEWLQDLPEEKQLLCYGLDFGFKPDPCALISLYKTDDREIFKEEWVKYELTSQDIIRHVHATIVPGSLIVADNARPEIIRDMQLAGLNVMACVKQEKIGREIVGVQGQIEMMQAAQFAAIGQTLEEEYLDYKYHETKDGTFVSKVPAGKDHCLDACRYAWYWVHRQDILKAIMSELLKEYK